MRAAAWQGHNRRHNLPPNGWETPIVIAMNMDLEETGKHKALANSIEIRRRLFNRMQVPLKELNIVALHMHKITYHRFQGLPAQWESLLEGQRVLCRTPVHRPKDFFKSGHGVPWSCGRTSAVVDGKAEDEGWCKAKKTLIWRCGHCEDNYQLGRSTVLGGI